jgi:hypothetical protein
MAYRTSNRPLTQIGRRLELTRRALNLTRFQMIGFTGEVDRPAPAHLRQNPRGAGSGLSGLGTARPPANARKEPKKMRPDFGRHFDSIDRRKESPAEAGLFWWPNAWVRSFPAS